MDPAQPQAVPATAEHRICSTGSVKSAVAPAAHRQRSTGSVKSAVASLGGVPHICSTSSVKSAVASAGSGTTIYVAFLWVGIGCGWFPVDALVNLVLNEPAVGPEWFGTIMLIIGVIGICQSAAFFVYRVVRRGGPLSVRAEQWRVLAVCLMTTAVLFVLSAFWSVGSPRFPVLVVGTVISVLLVGCTYLSIFPFVAAHYGGWLVGPLRTGTHLPSLVTALLGESQNPSGSHILFPSSLLLQAYSAITLAGACTWAVIVHYGIGLREPAAERPEGQEAKCPESGMEAGYGADGGKPPSALQRLSASLDGFACPRALLWFVVVGAVVDVLQGGVVVVAGDVGAEMTDPVGCGADRGLWVARTSFTANRIVLPLGGLASTLLPCSRRVFGALAVVQIVSAVAVLSACLGFFRGAWTTGEGQALYIACYALTGALGGYLLTMSYRFIGDMPGLPGHLRRSASSLLSLINILGVDTAALITGALVNGRVIRCTDP